MSWAIVFDSSCNLHGFKPSAKDCTLKLVPLTIMVGGTEYVDDDRLDVGALNRAVAGEDEASSSSCPSVGGWAHSFEGADNVIAVTISSSLSGSYEAAVTARNMVMESYMVEHAGNIAGKNIFVLDSHAAGGKLELLVRLIDRYLSNNPGAAFDDVVAYARALETHAQVLFSLSSYDNLTKNGRMPKLAGILASHLKIRLLGTSNAAGAIKVAGSTRGERKTVAKIVSAMGSDGYRGGMVSIDHVDNEAMAQALKRAIIERWPAAEVYVEACRGLCSYYAEMSGIIVGYEWL